MRSPTPRRSRPGTRRRPVPRARASRARPSPTHAHRARPSCRAVLASFVRQDGTRVVHAVLPARGGAADGLAADGRRRRLLLRLRHSPDDRRRRQEGEQVRQPASLGRHARRGRPPRAVTRRRALCGASGGFVARRGGIRGGELFYDRTRASVCASAPAQKSRRMLLLHSMAGERAKRDVLTALAGAALVERLGAIGACSRASSAERLAGQWPVCGSVVWRPACRRDSDWPGGQHGPGGNRQCGGSSDGL